MKTNNFSQLVTLFTIVFLPKLIVAQTGNTANTDTLWTTGKIFVVLIIAAVIFGGIGIFLLLLERRLSKLEQRTFQKNQ